jgi:hypothetical protein
MTYNQLAALNILLVSLGLVLSQQPVDAASCQPVVGPRVESAGSYCFSGNIEKSSGLVIDADNVTLDLSGFCLNGSAEAGITTTGISIAARRSNITIQNGCISGFMFGLLADSGSSHVRISRVEFRRNTFRAALVYSDDATIEDNRVDEVGGTSVFPDAATIAFELRGDRCSVRRNTVREVYPVDSGDSVGIGLTGSGCVVADNVIENTRRPPWGRTTGILTPADTKVERNRVVHQTYGFADPKQLSAPSGNAAIEDDCAEGSTTCPDDIGAALKALDVHDADDGRRLFRAGRAYHRHKNYATAAIYYLAASKRGVEEGRRVVERHLIVGYINSADATNAERESERILTGIGRR